MIRREFLRLCGGGMALLSLRGRAVSACCKQYDRLGAGTTFMAFDEELASYEVNANSQTIVRRSKEGSVVWRIGREGKGDGQFRQPNAVAVSHDGSVYIVDVRNHRIQVFSRDGKYRFGFSGFGSAPGALNNPRGDLVCFRQAVYLCDSGNHRMQVFSGDGVPLRQFGEESLSYPVALAVTSNANVYVADAHMASIMVFDANGQLKHSFDCGGELVYPCSLLMTAAGELLVADSGRARIFICSPGGEIEDSIVPITENGVRCIPHQLVKRDKDINVLAYPLEVFRSANSTYSGTRIVV